jgi:OFA family oxalate/formate antiporter-like MFS transporter
MNNAVSKWQDRHTSILNRKRFWNALVPAILLALAVGQIYAFTIFSDPIAKRIGVSQPRVQFAFSLGIFFLGMGAAFFGKIVEKNIRLSGFVGLCLFLSGLLVTALGVQIKSLWTIYLGYGFMVGLGTGIIYITPVKTLMLWFLDHKAIAAAIPIISFGLGSSLCTLLEKALRNCCSTAGIFCALAGIYAIPMLASALLLHKPLKALRADRLRAKDPATTTSGFTYGKLLSNGWFLRAWLFMFLNISCGLSLIPLSKQLMNKVGMREAVLTAVITGCGLMNGAGRLVFAWWSDRLARRIDILLILLGLSLAVMLVPALLPLWIGLTLLVINACYGAGFSTIPAVLADHFGMQDISKIHGAVLSAWGVAGLVGNQVSLRVFDRWGHGRVIALLASLYAVNIVNVMTLRFSRPRHP